MISCFCSWGEGSSIPHRKHKTITLDLKDLKKFNNSLIAKYSEFVANAPPEWREDDFLTSHSPVAIASRYGQDQSICIPEDLHREAITWDEERPFDKLRWVSIAIATDIRFEFSKSLLHCQY